MIKKKSILQLFQWSYNFHIHIFILKMIIIQFVSIRISYFWSLSFAPWKYSHYHHESIAKDWFIYNIYLFHFKNQRYQMNIFNDNVFDKIDDDMKFSDSIFLFKVAFFICRIRFIFSNLIWSNTFSSWIILILFFKKAYVFDDRPYEDHWKFSCLLSY